MDSELFSWGTVLMKRKKKDEDNKLLLEGLVVVSFLLVESGARKKWCRKPRDKNHLQARAKTPCYREDSELHRGEGAVNKGSRKTDC